jgi:hypothetical protein
MDGDKNKYVFSRKPSLDYVWEGGARGDAVQKKAPDGSVFVVIISENDRHKDKFPEVDGWIDRWNWVREDEGLRDAPSGWVDRYKEKIWTRR